MEIDVAEEEELTQAIDKALLGLAQRALSEGATAATTALAAAIKDLADARAWITHPHKRSGS